jgi:hypothetical protein
MRAGVLRSQHVEALRGSMSYVEAVRIQAKFEPALLAALDAHRRA